MDQRDDRPDPGLGQPLDERGRRFRRVAAALPRHARHPGDLGLPARRADRRLHRPDDRAVVHEPHDPVVPRLARGVGRPGDEARVPAAERRLVGWLAAGERVEPGQRGRGPSRARRRRPAGRGRAAAFAGAGSRRAGTVDHRPRIGCGRPSCDTRGMAETPEPIEETVLYAGGGIKYTGFLLDGTMHGAWSWFRTDGSLMRTGEFDHGRQVGTWRTYDRAGAIVKETSFPHFVVTQTDDVLRLVEGVLGRDLIGAYAHGSAVLGGLRSRSDIDVLVVGRRPPTRRAASRARRGLPVLLRRWPCTRTATRRARGGRPVRRAPVAPPATRRAVARRVDARRARGWRSTSEPGPSPDLAPLLTMVLLGDRALLGPPPAEVLDPVPADDLRRAIVEGIPGLLADLDTDTRNVLLTFARIWTTLETGEIRPRTVRRTGSCRGCPRSTGPCSSTPAPSTSTRPRPTRLRSGRAFVPTRTTSSATSRPSPRPIASAVAAGAPPGARSFPARKPIRRPYAAPGGDQPLNDRVIADFRANGGAVTFPPYLGARLLLLTSTGANLGEPHVAPLGTRATSILGPRDAAEGDYAPGTAAWRASRPSTTRRRAAPRAPTCAAGPSSSSPRSVPGPASCARPPLMRVEHDGIYAVVASLGGAPKHPVWDYNLKQESPRRAPGRRRPSATTWPARSPATRRRRWWARAVEAWPDYARYQTKTERQIPVFVLEPIA